MTSFLAIVAAVVAASGIYGLLHKLPVAVSATFAVLAGLVIFFVIKKWLDRIRP